MATQDIKAAILAKIQAAKDRGADKIPLRSGQLQTEWELKNKLPPICDAMKSLFRPGDRIQELPQKPAHPVWKETSTPKEPLSNNNPPANNSVAAGWRLFI